MFFMNSETNFRLDPTKDIKFPHGIPLQKSLTFCNVMTFPKVSNLYNGGVWGNSHIFCWIQLNFFSECIKNVDTYHISFQLKIKSNKNVIAKKLSVSQANPIN